MQVMEKNKSPIEKDLLILAISTINFLSANEKALIYNSVDTLDSLSNMTVHDMEKIAGRKLVSKTWNGTEAAKSALRGKKIMTAFNIKYFSMFCEEYPETLKNIPDLPFALFYRGDFSILNNQCVGIVGSRMITPDGKQETFDFAKQAADSGLTVVSGLATGVDYYAHLGALKSDSGRTVAILPSGIDTIVPTCNKQLAGAIIKRGCLLSEYPPGATAMSWRFVQRNRLIAGVSSDVILVQAPPASGALITADFVEDYGRELYILKTAFSPMALQAVEIKKKKIASEMASGKKKNYKSRRNICNLVMDDGIPVIDDYEDFIKCKSEKPGTRFYDVSNIAKLFDI